MVTCILGSGQTDTNGKYVTKWMSESEFPEKNNDQHENMIIPTVTVGKSQTNVTNVTMHPHSQAIWGHIWKHTLEKSRTNATNVIMPLLMQAIWGDIWRHTVEKSQINATSVTMPLLVQAIWGNI